MEREYLFDTVFDELPMAIFIVDDDFRVKFLNTEAKKLITENSKIIDVRGGELLDCIRHRLVADGCGRSDMCKECMLRNSVNVAISGVKTYKTSVVLELNKEGKVESFYANITSLPIVFKGERLVLLIVEDENMMVNLNKSLTQKVKELKTLHESKDTIMRIVSHDLKNLIGSTLMTIDLLQRQEINEKAAKHIRTLETATQRALSLVKDILETGEIESPDYQLDLEPHFIDEYLKGIIDQFKPLCETKNIDFVTDFSAECVKVKMHTDKMWQILQNIVHNAIKFTPQGGRVSLKTEIDDDATSVKDYTNSGDLQSTYRESYVLIKIIDSGIGIPAEHIPVLFDKFTKAKRKGTDGEDTTGIGLSITKRLVELHHGEISVHSAPGAGTEFCIKLPIFQIDNTKDGR